MDNLKRIDIVSKCHDIQVCLGNKTIPEYDAISEIGMMVRLALHIRGLPQIDYTILKLVADYYLQIPATSLKAILYNLADINFIIIDKDGSTVKSILPNVPYFDDVYSSVGDFAVAERHFSEPEMVIIEILRKLSESPVHKSNLYNIGTDTKVINRTLSLGNQGGFLLERRARGKDIVLSPSYFMDNEELYIDLVAKSGANQVGRLNKILKENQGWPLSVIEQRGEINGTIIHNDEINMLKRLAQDGAIKPPSIVTEHAGSNYFMFTPTPGNARLHPGKKEIYERATAMVSSVRQGQLLPKRYAIRSPYYLLSSFKDKGYLKASTEATSQYKALAIMRMCTLDDVGGSWRQLRLIDTPENREALDIAISLVQGASNYGTEVDEEARLALQKDQEYIESRRSVIKLRELEPVILNEEQKEEIENLMLEGMV